MGRTKSSYDWQKSGRLAFFDGQSHETLLPMFPVVLFD